MIYLFNPQANATNDASLTFLHGIFGDMGGFIAPNTGYLQGTFQLLLPNMFKQFNTIILAVGALVVVYVTIVGIMNTAHQGQFMGKDWNNLWIPIRTVLGISMLVPTASNYSYIQLIMMWVIIQGIGAANLLWRSVLETIQGPGSEKAFNKNAVSPPATAARQSFKDLFKSMVCADSVKARYPNPYTNVTGSSGSGNDNSYYCNVNPGNAACKGLPVFPPTDGRNYSMGPNDACGVLTICDYAAACADPASMACKGCESQIASFQSAMALLSVFSEKLVQIDYDYQRYYYATSDPKKATQLPTDLDPDFIQFVKSYCTKKGITPCTGEPQKLPSPLGDSTSAPSIVVDEIYSPYIQSKFKDTSDFIEAATGQYLGNMKKALENYNAPVELTGELKKAMNTGWIMAGSYYMVLARMNKSIQKGASPDVTVRTDSSSAPNNETSDIYHYRTNIAAADRLMSGVSGGNAAGENRDTAAIAGPAASTTNDVAGSADKMSKPSNTMNPGPEPLTALAIGGYAMLLAVQIFYIILLLIAVLAGVSTISVFVVGTGVHLPTESIWTFLFYFIIPLIWLVLGLMVSIGATLAIYVPMIPYVIFTIGAVGWLFSTIEAMIAGPIVALGILSPSGHHEILGEAKPAMMMLFSIFLRPSLMIFGMVAAILLSGVSVNMVNIGFNTVFTNLFDFAGAGGGAGMVAAAVNPLALVFILVAYVSLIITVLNKCFAAIHLVPERVLRWIGHHDQGIGGEDAAVGEMKGAIGGAAGKAQQQMEKGIKDRGQKKVDEDKAQKQKGGGGTTSTPGKKT